MTITDVTQQDLPEILEVQKAAFKQIGVLENDPALPPLTQTLPELRQDFDTRFTILKLVDDDGTIIGSIRGYCENNTCYIHRVVVLPGYQGRGLGKKLMQVFEERFNTVDRYELFTGKNVTANVRFYEKLGYTVYKETTQGKSILVYMEKINHRQ